MSGVPSACSRTNRSALRYGGVAVTSWSRSTTSPSWSTSTPFAESYSAAEPPRSGSYPSPEKEVSRSPSGSSRATKLFWTLVPERLPATTIVPSGPTSMSRMDSSPPRSRITTPSPPKDGSRRPSGSSRTTTPSRLGTPIEVDPAAEDAPVRQRGHRGDLVVAGDVDPHLAVVAEAAVELPGRGRPLDLKAGAKPSDRDRGPVGGGRQHGRAVARHVVAAERDATGPVARVAVTGRRVNGGRSGEQTSGQHAAERCSSGRS